MNVVESTTVDVRGFEVPVQMDGSGPPLLLLHGAGGAGIWGDAHRALAETFRVIAPVHPGFGGTPLPDWVDGADDMAFHYIDLIAALQVQRPLVVGLSLGGFIATELAIFRPELLGGLVLVDAVGLRPDQPMPDLFIMDPMESLGVLFNDPAKALAASAPTFDLDFVIRQYEESAVVARLMWRRPYDAKLDRRLHLVSCPALVLWGADDRLLPPSHGQKLASLLPNARFQVIDGAGHAPAIEAPDAVVSAICQFAQTLD